MKFQAFRIIVNGKETVAIGPVTFDIEDEDEGFELEISEPFDLPKITEAVLEELFDDINSQRLH